MSMIGKRHEFGPIVRVAGEMLERFDRPWFICGGWAIDLFLRRVTRPHSDREVGIYRTDQLLAQERFSHRALFKAVDGHWLAWEPAEHLELPVHQVLLRKPGAAAPTGDWDPATEDFELFLNESEDGA